MSTELGFLSPIKQKKATPLAQTTTGEEQALKEAETIFADEVGNTSSATDLLGSMGENDKEFALNLLQEGNTALLNSTTTSNPQASSIAKTLPTAIQLLSKVIYSLATLLNQILNPPADNTQGNEETIIDEDIDNTHKEDIDGAPEEDLSDEVDINKDGTITQEEYDKWAYSNIDITDKIDTNKDGKITESELINYSKVSQDVNSSTPTTSTPTTSTPTTSTPTTSTPTEETQSKQLIAAETEKHFLEMVGAQDAQLTTTAGELPAQYTLKDGSTVTISNKNGKYTTVKKDANGTILSQANRGVDSNGRYYESQYTCKNGKKTDGYRYTYATAAYNKNDIIDKRDYDYKDGQKVKSTIYGPNNKKTKVCTYSDGQISQTTTYNEDGSTKAKYSYKYSGNEKLRVKTASGKKTYQIYDEKSQTWKNIDKTKYEQYK